MLTPLANPIASTRPVVALAAVATILALVTTAACLPGLSSSPTVVVTISGAWQSPTPGPSPTPLPDPDLEAGRLIQLTQTRGTESDPVWSPDGAKIAFECFSDGWLRTQLGPDSHPQGDSYAVRNWQIISYYFPGAICIMNADGSDRKQLTEFEADAFDPAWSPDSSKIAFSSRPDLNRDIYVMNADGSGVRQVTNDEYDDDHPTWSPDGSKIAFSSWRDEKAGIFVIDVDGSNLTRITDGRNGVGGRYLEPAWAPDGTRIAFANRWSGVSGRTVSGIFVVNSDGTNETELYSIYGKAGSPAWSSDSKTITFTSDVRRDSHYAEEILVVDSDGSGLKRLTYRRGTDESPTWSPDGSKLAFVSWIQGYPDIYTLTDFQTHLQRLTDNAHSDTAPTWSPDGTRIAFVSDRGGDDEIYVMNPNGTGIVQLTNEAHSLSYGPAWSPDGSRVAYQSSESGTDGGHYNIFVVNENGTENVRLTSSDVDATTRLNSALSWSPDGTRIAYVSNLNGHYQAHVMNSDGTNHVSLGVEGCLSYAAAEGYEPHWSSEDTGIAWSPDGSMLVLSCLDSNFRLIDPSGELLAQFYGCSDRVSAPAWAPDGTRIAFACGIDRKNDIYAIDISDDEATRFNIGDRRTPQPSLSPYATHVVNGDFDYVQPAWSPDGTKLAYASNRDGDYEVYVLDLERAP